jgi:hypothetical protein
MWCFVEPDRGNTKGTQNNSVNAHSRASIGTYSAEHGEAPNGKTRQLEIVETV